MSKEVPFAETFPPPQKHITLSRAILLLFLFPAVATEGLKLRDHVQLGKEVFLITVLQTAATAQREQC